MPNCVTAFPAVEEVWILSGQIAKDRSVLYAVSKGVAELGLWTT